MTIPETAVALHREHGNNCCQSVLCSTCALSGLDPDTAYRMGAFFGRGMRCGETCGTVSGVLMALGMRYGDENNRTCTASREFLKTFEEKFGALRCRDLLAKNGKPFCDTLIAFAADYLEDHL